MTSVGTAEPAGQRFSLQTERSRFDLAIPRVAVAGFTPVHQLHFHLSAPLVRCIHGPRVEIGHRLTIPYSPPC